MLNLLCRRHCVFILLNISGNAICSCLSCGCYELNNLFKMYRLWTFYSMNIVINR